MGRIRYKATIDNEEVDIGSAPELVVALDVLQGQHDRVLLEQLQEHLVKILEGPAGLDMVLKVLIEDDQCYLVKALGSQLVDVIDNASAFRDLLAKLRYDSVEDTMIQTLGGEGLRKLVGTAGELAEVLEWVYGKSDRIVIDLIGKPYIKRIIENGYDLSLILNSLGVDYQKELLEDIGLESVVTLIHDRRDLAYLLRALPFENSKPLLDTLTKEHVNKLVPTKRGWLELIRTLEKEEIQSLSELLEENYAA